MSKIKIDVAHKPVAQRLLKGAEFLQMGAANENVPGNEALIAALTAAQAALRAAEEAAEAARNLSKQRTAERDAALKVWMTAVMSLASFTQSATAGDAGKILSAGFGVCDPPAPVPAPGMVTGVTVALNGTPGHSRISWNAVSGADGYLVQGSADPTVPTSWAMPVISMKPHCEGNGAVPGRKYWYRVAAFNANGQGPWSMAAERPVM